MNSLNAVAVFCGSSEGNDTTIISKAEDLGKILAIEDITLVYGAAKIGIMGKIAKASLDSHGKVIGVIPEFLKPSFVLQTTKAIGIIKATDNKTNPSVAFVHATCTNQERADLMYGGVAQKHDFCFAFIFCLCVC